MRESNLRVVVLCKKSEAVRFSSLTSLRERRDPYCFDILGPCEIMERVSSLSRRPIVQADSMPLIMYGRTSLSLLASVGLTNLQLLQILLAVVFLLHAADGAMLPGIFKALEENLANATPVTLGSIVFVEALCHSVAVLVWGVLADRYCKLTMLMYANLDSTSARFAR
eukprot:s893_g30.t1